MATPSPKRSTLWFLLQTARNARRFAERSNQQDIAEAFQDVEEFIEGRMPIPLNDYTGPRRA